MNALLSQMDAEFVRSLVLTLLHTLWQAAAIAGVLAMLLRLFPAHRAGLRYRLCTLGLLLVLMGAGTTGAILGREPAPVVVAQVAVTGDPTHALADPAPPVSSASTIAPVAAPPPSTNADWTLALAITWAIGVLVMLARILLAVAGVRRMCRAATPLNSESALEAAETLCRRIGLRRRVRLMAIEAVRSPAVLGIVRPALLLPASMLSGLPAAHLQAIIAHELAHIRRWDYLVNLAQMLIEALLFFNPAVWWISRQMRIEREACCDAIAVAATGGPVGYAEALADWAERLADLAPLPGVAPAFAGRRSRGILLERVHRILRPGDRPAMRLSWPALFVVLITGALLLTALWRGTGLAVALAAEILTPEQRMQQIQQAAEKFAAPQIQSSDDPAQQVRLSGALTSADGRPLPPRGSMIVHSEAAPRTANTYLNWENGRFDTKAPPGMIWIVAEADGFAPTTVGPLAGEPGAVLKDINLTFTNGFPAEVHVRDDAGQPVANTEISIGMHIRGSGVMRAHRTDDKGILRIPHACNADYSLSISARGIQKNEAHGVRLRKDLPYTWTVQRAKPTTLTFIGADGQPVADALVRLFGETRGSHVRLHAWYGPEIGRTDAHGRIEVDILADGTTCTLLLEARDGRRQLIGDVQPGADARSVQLDPEIIVTGRITGDLSRLQRQRGKPAVQYHQTYEIDSSSHGGFNETAEVDVRDGVGHFTIRHLLPMKLTIRAGGESRSLNLRRSVDDLVFHLADPDEPAPVALEKRPVEIVLKAPPDHPTPTGALLLTTYHRERQHGTSNTLKLVDGRARTDVVVGSTVRWESDQLLGYWIPKIRFFDGILVTAGDGAQVIEIDAIPAGAIVGQVFDADGLPLDNVGISLYAAQKPPLPGEAQFENVHNIRTFNGRFMVGSLPLGGRYVAGMSKEYCYVFTEPVLIDAAHPTQELELRLVKGVDVPVVVEDSDGRPVADAPVGLHYRSPYSGHSVSPNPVTDANGHVIFRNVNPHAPGNGYSVSFEGRRHYLPASVPVTFDGRPIVLRLKRGCVVTGQVVDAETGWPIPRAEVSAVPIDLREGETNPNREAEEETDADGRFRFSTLDPGREYGFFVRQAARSTIPSPFRATADSNQELKIPITLADRSKLKPVPPADK